MPRPVSQEPKKYNISPQEVERRKRHAQEMIKAGKMGGQFGKLGGRPKVKRASELVAEAARDLSKEIIDAYKRGLIDESAFVRLKAAKELLDIETKEAELQIKEEVALKNATKDELIDELLGAFKKFNANEVLPTGFIDSEAEIVSDGQERSAFISPEGEET